MQRAVLTKRAPRGRVIHPSPISRSGGLYFASPKKHISFIRSGCKTLDLALGGGWAMGRVINIVGDRATGKTLLAIEAAANFATQYPKGKIHYRESESAFDMPYAEALGMPLERVDFQPMETVEDMFVDLEQCCQTAKQPELYILDSLDALSDEAELLSDFGKASFGTAKAKGMSKLFRKGLIRRMRESQVTLMIISQERDKIGITFGRKSTRAGGRALDFYASQALWIAQLNRVVATHRGIKRAVGIDVRAKVDKNKVGLAYRECDFRIKFGYGIDDENACRRWLKKAKQRVPDKMPLSELQELTEKTWWEVETSFLPTKKKYG